MTCDTETGVRAEANSHTRAQKTIDRVVQSQQSYISTYTSEIEIFLDFGPLIMDFGKEK
jgi:hypothetical protein